MVVFTKVGDSFERTWHRETFRGQWIVPGAREQSFNACVFCSFSAGGDMERMKEMALKGALVGDLKFDEECLKKDYIKFTGVPLGEEVVDRASTTAWIFESFGVEATCSEWNDKERRAISGHETYQGLPFWDAVNLLDSGKPLLGSFFAGNDLDDLGEDEIYTYTTAYDAEGVQIPPARHRVLFIGYGVTEDNKSFLTFLNSYGEEFGEDGTGRVFFDEVSDFYTLSIDADPAPPTSSLDDVVSRSLH